MADVTTERILELQNRLRIRLAELGFDGVQASNVVHHLAEAAALAEDITQRSLPLFLEMSASHRESLASVASKLKQDMDELRDAIQDIEPDLTELLKYLRGES